MHTIASFLPEDRKCDFHPLLKGTNVPQKAIIFKVNGSIRSFYATFIISSEINSLRLCAQSEFENDLLTSPFRKKCHFCSNCILFTPFDLMSAENGEVRYCRQCRKNMPLEDFVNRTKNGYCIVCKTCRDRQLKRYYGRTYEEKQG